MNIQQYSIFNFFFVYYILIEDSNLDMGSLDIGPLFTNTPLDKTFNTCIKNNFSNSEGIFSYWNIRK